MVTERQSVFVPLTHQVVRIERIPIAEAGRGTVPGIFAVHEYAVVLHAERPVVTTELVAVE